MSRLDLHRCDHVSGLNATFVNQFLVGLMHPVDELAAGIHNLGAEAMGVNCQLMKAGVVLEEVEIYLEANGQEAQYIEGLFTSTDTSDFVGSVRCTAPGEGMFTGVAVELDADNRIFTTLPVVPVVDVP